MRRVLHSMFVTPLMLVSMVGVSAHASGEHAVVVEQAEPGTLDASFGQGGVVVTDLGENAYGVAITARSRIVAAGTLHTDEGWMGSDLALVAYLLDGSLDPSFGDGGVVTTDFRQSDRAVDVQIDSEGRVLVLVGVGTARDTRGAMLARYTADGTLDASFGEGGFVHVGTRLYPVRLALQPDGKIVVAARSSPIVLTRYTADGQPDTTFGKGGRVVSPLMSPNDRPVALAVLRDGKLLVIGRTLWLANPDVGKSHVALLRYLPQGSLDPSFGVDGIIRYRIPLWHEVMDGEVTPRGKIVALVSAWANTSFCADSYRRQTLRRFRSDGQADATFDGDGRARVDSLNAREIALQTSGMILVVGESCLGEEQENAFSLARLRDDGSIDVRFGTDGTVVNLIGDLPAVAKDVVLQSDDRVLVIGTAWEGLDDISGSDLAVARYVAD